MTQNFHTPLPTNAPALYSSLNTISSDLDAGITGALIGDHPFTQLSFADPDAKTIAGGVITVTNTFVTVDTEGAAASDDLVTINGAGDSDLVLLKIANAARVVTVKHNTGNIYLADGGDLVLYDTRQVLPLLWDGTKWAEVGVRKGRFVPRFKATKTANQTLATATLIKLTWQTEDEDVGGGFDLANDRFQPTMPGKYLIAGSALYLTAVDQMLFALHIHKNGASIKQKPQRASGTASHGADVFDFVELNGSTDYVELYGYHEAGSNRDISSSLSATQFTGILLAQYKV